MGCFIYDRDLRHERVNLKTEILSSTYLYLALSRLGDFAKFGWYNASTTGSKAINVWCET